MEKSIYKEDSALEYIDKHISKKKETSVKDLKHFWTIKTRCSDIQTIQINIFIIFIYYIYRIP